MATGGKPEILIVGCGVSGLTSGIRLYEAGFPVTIVARDLPPKTTSDVAAAVWYPYKVGADAQERVRVLAWSQVTVDAFRRLATDATCGVSWTTLVLFFKAQQQDPYWKNIVDNFRHAQEAKLPQGYRDAHIAEVPLIETPKYMPYLRQRFEQLGGHIRKKKVRYALAELLQENRLIVNCTGLGARGLAESTVPDDEQVHPARGRVIRVKKVAGLDCCLVDEEDPKRLTYIIPRSNDCILGGTYEEHKWSTAVSPTTTAQILRRCKKLAPELKSIREDDILNCKAGLRPVRNKVRLEQDSQQPDIIHNYGHGGAGFTLSWGCADEVVQVVQKVLGLSD